jgi:predicted RNA binding protein YcfA (HicA-like mRNA interferase family)
MKLPRDLAGADLVKGLQRVGYVSTRQTGDHLYMTTQENGEHHVSVPLHKFVKLVRSDKFFRLRQRI